MPIETKLSKTWRNRQLLIAAFLAGFAAWFCYDGWVGYPATNKAYEAHEKLKAEGREEEWPELSRTQGWRLQPPEHPYDTGQIRQQFVMAGVSLAGSLFALGLLGMNLKRQLRSDDEAVYGENGNRVPLDAITSVDRKKWDSKGIAIAHYEDNGRRRKLVIDDYKFAGGEDILKQVETHLAARDQS